MAPSPPPQKEKTLGKANKILVVVVVLGVTTSLLGGEGDSNISTHICSCFKPHKPVQLSCRKEFTYLFFCELLPFFLFLQSTRATSQNCNNNAIMYQYTIRKS